MARGPGKNPARRSFIDSQGYWRVYAPYHPQANNDYIHEHILVAERALGRLLPTGAVIHHYASRSDNTRIVICGSQSYHFLLHRRAEAKQIAGDVNYWKCDQCHEYSDPRDPSHEMSVIKRANGTNIAYHRECKAAYMRRRNQQRKARAQV